MSVRIKRPTPYQSREVCMDRISWDAECVHDLITNNGFMITDPPEVQINDSKKKALHGTRSPLYGTSYEDEQAFIERYRCTCGEFQGKMFENEICPICHTPVTFKDVNIGFTGWMSTGKYFFIAPHYYRYFSKLLGKGVIDEICQPKMMVDTNGIRKPIPLDQLEVQPKHPFYGIGVRQFLERYDEILDYFKKKKSKQKWVEFEAVRREKSKVFSSKIPVYTTFLRPQSSTADTLYYSSIDRIINPLNRLCEKLRNGSRSDLEIDYWLAKVEQRVLELYDLNMGEIETKEGWIRKFILGGSLNYTARNVICPSPDLQINQVDLSYNTFRIIFRNVIIFTLMKMDGLSLASAYHKWAESINFSNKIYGVMEYIREKMKPMVLINRNPTLKVWGPCQ